MKPVAKDESKVTGPTELRDALDTVVACGKTAANRWFKPLMAVTPFCSAARMSLRLAATGVSPMYQRAPSPL
jgi:hypothetical protein